MNALIFLITLLTALSSKDTKADQEVYKNGKKNIVREHVTEDGYTVYYSEFLGDGNQDNPDIHNPPPKREDVVFVRAKQQASPEFTEEEPVPDPNIPIEKQPEFLQKKKEFEEKKKAFLKTLKGQN